MYSNVYKKNDSNLLLKQLYFDQNLVFSVNLTHCSTTAHVSFSHSNCLIKLYRYRMLSLGGMMVSRHSFYKLAFAALKRTTIKSHLFFTLLDYASAFAVYFLLITIQTK